MERDVQKALYWVRLELGDLGKGQPLAAVELKDLALASALPGWDSGWDPRPQWTAPRCPDSVCCVSTDPSVRGLGLSFAVRAVTGLPGSLLCGLG